MPSVVHRNDSFGMRRGRLITSHLRSFVLSAPFQVSFNCRLALLRGVMTLTKLPGLAGKEVHRRLSVPPRQRHSRSVLRAVVYPVLMRLKPTDVFPAALLLYRSSVTKPAANRGCDGNGLPLA